MQPPSSLRRVVWLVDVTVLGAQAFDEVDEEGVPPCRGQTYRRDSVVTRFGEEAAGSTSSCILRTKRDGPN